MTATVLIVDDDPIILSLMEEWLDARGFAVLSARSGGEALSILGSGLHDIAVLVADIRIGDGIDGWEIARCARDITPDLPIVYVSGDSVGDWERQGVAESRVLQKPFTEAALAEAIDDLVAAA